MSSKRLNAAGAGLEGMAGKAPKVDSGDRFDDSKLEDIAKAFKGATDEAAQVETGENAADHSRALEGIGSKYLETYFPTEKGKKRVHDFTHLGEFERTKHAKALVRDFAKYLMPHAWGSDTSKNLNSVKDFVNQYLSAQGDPEVRNYDALVSYIKRTKGLRNNMSTGKLKQLFQQAAVKVDANTLTEEQAEPHFQKIEHYKPLIAAANNALKPYQITLAEGTPYNVAVATIKNSGSKKWKPTLDDAPGYYVPAKKAA
jgi:hypothetical protein